MISLEVSRSNHRFATKSYSNYTPWFCEDKYNQWHQFASSSSSTTTTTTTTAAAAAADDVLLMKGTNSRYNKRDVLFYVSCFKSALHDAPGSFNMIVLICVTVGLLRRCGPMGATPPTNQHTNTQTRLPKDTEGRLTEALQAAVRLQDSI